MMGGPALRAVQVMDIRESLAGKLKSARKLSGMSTRSVAERISKRLPVSHATVANYEAGKSIPPMNVLAALAEAYDRPINWFLERGRNLSGIRYRNLKSRVRAGDLHRFEADVQRWVDAYITLETRLNKPLLARFENPQAAINANPDEFSREIRRKFELSDEDPISSVVEVLENFGVRVLEHTTDLRIDGIAAKYSDEYIVVLNPTVSNDRGRLNAAHELAHVLYGDCDSDESDSKAAEHRAFEFASHFLLPNNQLKRAFVGKSMVRLVQFKERFGISLAAMVYRAEKLGFITKSEAKMLWIEFVRRGWKSSEPGYVRPDRATRFEQLVDETLASGKMSIREIADLAGARPDAIRERLNYAMGIRCENAFEDDEAVTIKFPK